MWLIVFVAIAVVSALPLGALWIRDAIKPLDIVNDPRVVPMMRFAVRWLACFATIELAWVVYGAVFLMQAA